ncbi:acetyl-CoA carboxylase biotin carboxylase subunit [Jiella marina]|uniref:acetyl-CoA carboxylase biotin carboxylase subunit n=1 Tax=Jiella sp. LLJ827 TaxID=2917712 RepID=UPI0021014A18|nr:acetyl/propionyl/methylcrotonyl-CoA carboxylase subunit alpha [Jiella sp. LLJ827]MCQ0986911.1 acetyl/propionyl/methylcrotonyl-CoA carboxylase subunit alpha [Jiella sp. LLJ827]
MFDTLLIANRGEIACRVIRTAKRLGLRTVAVYSEADAGAMHVAMADEAVLIGPAPVSQSYLNAEAIIQAARRTGADAIHPGYGFLSENPDFVEAVAAAGLIFVGPSASAIRAMGLKDAAKRLMEEAGVPVVPGYHGKEQDPAFLAGEAERIGYPVLIKARAGGGGKGMRRVDDPAGFEDALEGARREAQSAFGDPRCLIEKFVATPRHIEIQIFGDGHGNVVHLFERDCSLQRRHQKVIEEAPAPGMMEEMRAAMGEAAVTAAKAIGYSGAGTVEFIVDASDGLRPDRFYFMEMNTRLQVEHPVTEAITGLDLVELQLRVASGEALPLTQADLQIDGHAFEARLYAEDPAKGFLPATGRITHLHLAEGSPALRIDTGVRQGDRVTPHYDPMIAKLIVHGPDRPSALRRLARALGAVRIAGLVTNAAFLKRLAEHEGFAAGEVDTGLIDRDASELTAPALPSARIRALAALAVHCGGAASDVEDRSPFARLAGFRAWGPARQAVRFAEEGGRTDMVVTDRGGGAYDVAPGDRPDETVRIDLVASECSDEAGAMVLRVVVEETQSSVHLLLSDDAVTVFSDGAAHILPLYRPSAAAETAPSVDRIVAPMPGTISKLAVEAGARVTTGAPLVVLEAMKMEHTLKAPRDGTIAELLVALGDQVEDGAVLVTFGEEA